MNDIDRLEAREKVSELRLKWQGKALDALLARVVALENRTEPEAPEPLKDTPNAPRVRECLERWVAAVAGTKHEKGELCQESMQALAAPVEPAWNAEQIAEEYEEFMLCPRCPGSGASFLAHLRGECKDV